VIATTAPQHSGFVWLREGYPKNGEWYDDSCTFEPAVGPWRANGDKVHVYAPDVAALVARVQEVERQVGDTTWIEEARVLADRLAEVTRERDWLRALADRLSAAGLADG
jgi:hypothetical protein